MIVVIKKIILVSFTGLMAMSALAQTDTNILRSTGDVGIGTLSPQANLEICGSGNFVSLKIRHKNELNLSRGLNFGQTEDLSGYISCSGRDLQIGSGWDKKLTLGFKEYDSYGGTVVFPGGNVGIGIDQPKSRLHIAGSNNLNWQESSELKGTGLLTVGDLAGNGSLFINTPTHNSYYSSGLGIDGSYSDRHSVVNIKAFGVKYSGWHSSLVFHTSNGTSLNEAMRIDRYGNIGIGTDNPAFKLDVNGTIRANEIKVTAQTADFVFEPNYNLRPLNEVEAFVKNNKHLPEIPSAKQMEADGVNVAEMNKLLLQKVEELTLYLIQMKKQHKESEVKNETELKFLKNELLKLKNNKSDDQN